MFPLRVVVEGMGKKGVAVDSRHPLPFCVQGMNTAPVGHRMSSCQIVAVCFRFRFEMRKMKETRRVLLNTRRRLVVALLRRSQASLCRMGSFVTCVPALRGRVRRSVWP